MAKFRDKLVLGAYKVSGRDNYYLRLVGTGISFAAFGLGGLLLSVFVFPVLYLLFGDRQKYLARRIIHRSFRLFMNFMQFMGITRWEVEGAAKLRDCRNAIVLANHPTLIDVVALIALMPNANCVVKQALWRNPLLGGVVRAAGYISNDAPDRLVEACAKDLASGIPLLIFPEGTRSRPGSALRFLRGASYIILDAGKPILPVLINCSPSTLTKSERWYQIPSRRFVLSMKVLDEVSATPWVDETVERPLAARRLTAALENFFTSQLNAHGFPQA